MATVSMRQRVKGIEVTTAPDELFKRAGLGQAALLEDETSIVFLQQRGFQPVRYHNAGNAGE